MKVSQIRTARAAQSIGAVAFAVAFLGLAVGGSLLVLAAWFIAGGVDIACRVETAQHAVVATNAPPEVRGSRSTVCT
jgi:hypothetical protein